MQTTRWLVLMGIVVIWGGAIMMARFRRGEHANVQLDRLGRAVFVLGFLVNLYNVDRALAGLVEPP